MAELTDAQRQQVRAHRAEVEALRDDYGRWVHVANATQAVLSLADGASVADVSRRLGQPEWRVGFWGKRVAELGASGIEVGYLPPGALGVEPRKLKQGVGVDCDLTPAAVAAWARSSWLSEGLGIDLDDEAVYLVWRESMEVVGFIPGERRMSYPRMSYIDYARKYHLPEDWAPSPGASIVVLSVEFQGDLSNPDTINRTIELASFLESQPGVLWFDP